MTAPLRWVFIATAAAIGLLGCSASSDNGLGDWIQELAVEETVAETAPGQVSDIGKFRPGPCEFETEHTPAPECGWLTVPMQRHEPQGATIDIHVARYRAWGDHRVSDAIVYLEGGPGVSALSEGDLTADWLWRLNRQRDLILFDQRGLGASRPGLGCPEIDAAAAKLSPEATSQESFEQERLAVSVCRRRLAEEGIDVSAYNTIEAAHDVADLRVALGLEEWNVLGVSYGTRLAQSLMRERPEGIRAVVLDGSYPLDDDPLYSVPRTGADALERLFESCAADPRCRERYPDLERRFRALVRALNDEPALVDFDDFALSSYPVTGDDMVEAVTSALYDAYSFVDVPRLVEITEAGETWALAAFVGGPAGGLGTSSDLGTFLSVNCHDEVAFAQPPPPFEDELGGNDERYVEDMTRACEVWDAGSAPAVENEPVSSDITSLVLVGRFDPITPTEHAAAVAANLDHATLVVFGDRGHGTLGDDCADSIAQAFLDDPQQSLDTGCAEQLDGPAFAPTDPGNLDLAEITVELGPVLRSEVPAQWVAAGTSAWARDRSLLDFTSVSFELSTSTSTRRQVQAQADLYPPSFAAHTVVDRRGQEWMTLSGVYLSDFVDVAVASIDGVTITVTLTSGVDERAHVTEAIWLDILAATRPS